MCDEGDPLWIIGLSKQVLGHCSKFILGVPSVEGVKAVAYPPGVEDKHVVRFGLITCGVLEEVTFDVVDDKRAGPAEDLGFGGKPLSAPRAVDNGEIAKLGAVWLRPDAYGVSAVPDAQKQILSVREGVGNEGRKLVGVRKARAVQFALGSSEEGRGGNPVKKHACAKGKLRETH